MTTRQFKVYAPLQDFTWDGDDFKLTPDLSIRRTKPDLQGLDAQLNEHEHNDAFFYAQHWLMFDWNEGTEPPPAETANLALLALWLAKPTKSYFEFRFELGQAAATGDDTLSRLNYRFHWVPGATHNKFEDSDLQSASLYYPALRKIYCAKSRLHDALSLTLMGCWSFQWNAALICHAAAIEALLTYSTAPGITRRLASCYACLVETHKDPRDAAYREFLKLYGVRSDIMHGRTHSVAFPKRLPILARFQNAFRMLWRKVISSPQIISFLEGPDAQRKAYFSKLTSGYTPPRR